MFNGKRLMVQSRTTVWPSSGRHLEEEKELTRKSKKDSNKKEERLDFLSIGLHKLEKILKVKDRMT
jgi:hypothetical protein